MHIKQLRLINFQCHSDLTLDLTKDINIIFGKTDTGKSAIRRAIEWCLFNQAFEGLRKSGTKETSVSITLDNDIEIERVRSISINRYILRIPEKKDQQFDAVAKSIPDEIKDILKINPIEVEEDKIFLNSYPQLSLPFLFDKSPTWRMKLFNQLTGNDLLDLLFVSFNKDLLKMNRNLGETKERYITQIETLKNKEDEKEQLEFKFEKAQQILKTIKIVEEHNSKLLQLQELYNINFKILQTTQESLNTINLPEPQVLQQLTDNLTKLDTFKALYSAFLGVQQLEAITSQLDKLNQNLLCNIDDLPLKIDRLAKLKELEEKLEINVHSEVKVSQQISSIKLDDTTFKLLNEKFNKYEKLIISLTNLEEYDKLILDSEKIQKCIKTELEQLEKEKNKFKLCPTCKGTGFLNE